MTFYVSFLRILSFTYGIQIIFIPDFYNQLIAINWVNPINQLNFLKTPNQLIEFCFSPQSIN